MAWKPEDVDGFIKDYLDNMTYGELAEKYNGSYNKVKHYLGRVLTKSGGIPKKKLDNKDNLYSPDPSAKLDAFKAFLKIGRTYQEMHDRFGDEVDDLIQHFVDEGDLITNINNFGRKIFMIIPMMKEPLELPEREWTFCQHLSQDEDADHFQPYLLCNIPEEKYVNKEIIIAPLYDIHYGSYAHKKKKFLTYLNWIAENDNMFTFFGGDETENALDDGRGMCYGQEIPPAQQVEEFCKMVAPIRHKILFMLSGNHGARSYKKAGIDTTKIIADRLDVPYSAGPLYCSVVVGDHKWKIYASHGRSAAMTKGGKINAAQAPMKYTDFIHFYASGHVHDASNEPDTWICEDPVNCRIIYPTTYTVICPSFMRWENSYAWVAGYKPPSNGGSIIKLYSNGNYQAVHQDLQ